MTASIDPTPTEPPAYGPDPLVGDHPRTRARMTDGTRARTRRMRRANSTVADGLANGFAEASLAFSEEVRGGATCADVLESAAAGVLRANGTFLAELGDAVRRASDEFVDDRIAVDATFSGTSIDYERLADLVADRFTSRATPQAREFDYELLADLVSERLSRRVDPI